MSAGHRRPISILHAPTPLGLKAPTVGVVPGVRRMPAVLQELGLHEMLDASYAGEVVPGEYDPRPDPSLNMLNPHAVRDHAIRLADRVQHLHRAGTMPLVLGGDCSVLVGCALAVRRMGRFGLVFLDGHVDFHTPATSSTAGIAGMDLAVVTGTGPGLLCDIDGLRPYFRPTDVVQVGCRDPHAPVDPAGRLRGTRIRVVGVPELKARGARSVADWTLSYLNRDDIDGFWVHVDADVLDDDIMPAVDSRQPGGLSAGELASMLRRLQRSGRMVGMNATIYDPDRDPTRGAGRLFSRILAAGFARRGHDTAREFSHKQSRPGGAG